MRCNFACVLVVCWFFQTYFSTYLSGIHSDFQTAWILTRPTKMPCGLKLFAKDRVKSGKSGRQVNSDTHLQTVEIQTRRLQDFHCLLINVFIIPIIELWNKQGGCPNLAVCPKLPDFTLPVMRRQKCRRYQISETPLPGTACLIISGEHTP